MGSVYACIYPRKRDVYNESFNNKFGEIIISEIKELILEEFDKGNIIFCGIGVLQGGNLKEFIKQPTDGILYDLNLLEETVLSQTENQKWINDFAVAKVIRALKERISELESQKQNN